jgi:hypothetical protein
VSQWLKPGFGLVIGFINKFQVVTTIYYYTIVALHNLQSLHTNLFSLSVLVFTDLYRILSLPSYEFPVAISYRDRTCLFACFCHYCYS